MTTIEITDIADVQDGDIVTLRWEEEPGITVTLEGPAKDSTLGDYTITSARFVSATRQAPEWEPGTAGTATVGPKRRQTRAYSVGEGALVEAVGGGYAVWKADDVHSFVPDDAEALRAEVKRLRAAFDDLTEQWRAKNAECEHLNALISGSAQYLIPADRASEGLVGDAKALRDEVERLRAARTREQIAKVLFRATTGTASEANAGADAVLTLLEEGGA